MRSKVAIALITPLFVMVGCGGSKDSASKVDGPVVPYTANQPAELADRSPATTPCRAADLSVQGQVDLEAYGNGGGIAVIALQHKGTQTCRLEGTPQVRLLKDGGPKQVNAAIQR